MSCKNFLIKLFKIIQSRIWLNLNNIPRILKISITKKKNLYCSVFTHPKNLKSNLSLGLRF